MSSNTDLVKRFQSLQEKKQVKEKELIRLQTMLESQKKNLEEAMKELKQFDVSTLEEGEELLRTKKEELNQSFQEIDTELKKYEEVEF